MNRLITYETAVRAKVQHTTPCSDCPWARTALPGWLGGDTVEGWLRSAHGEHVIECHTQTNAHCAGIAIYRKNVVKSVSFPNLLLQADPYKVFVSPIEFRNHHNRKKANHEQSTT